MPIKFVANSNILVVGCSGSGKTTSVLRIIRERLIDPMPTKIFYMYGAYQKEFDIWKENKSNPRIDFIEGLNLQVIDQFKEPKLLIIDDLMLDLDRTLAQHFIAGSSHKNTTTIFMSHSLFLNNELYRLISNNSQYIILMKNKRNVSQVSTLGRQILGPRQDLLQAAYKYIKPFEFVLLSFHPLVPEELLVTTNYFEKCPSVFT